MRRVARPIAAVFGVLALWGCAASPRVASTRLQGTDLREASARVAESLGGWAELASRGAAAPEWRWRLTRAENLSTDRLSEVDRWMIVSRVFFEPGMIAMLRERNTALYMPEQDAQAIRSLIGDLPAQTADESHTHVVRAEVRTMTRGAARAAGELADLRTETYLILFSVTELSSGRVAWADTFEIKRAAFGTLVN